MEWIKFGFSALFMIIGVFTLLVSMFGVFKYKFAMNRMHFAALGDTLGLLSCLLSVIIFFGFSFTILKIFLVIAFLWFASPVSSHLMTRLEATTNDELVDECEVRK